MGRNRQAALVGMQVKWQTVSRLLARRSKKVVKRVVDHILDPPQQPQPARDVTVPNLEECNIDPILAPLDANTIDWLNTIDWTQGSWIEFN
jgi:hypothetical protein